MCFINDMTLIAIIDMGETHSFISHYCVIKLNLVVSPMKGSMVIDTSDNVYVTTLLVCLNCPLTIYVKYFGVDLICLPLRQLDVILGINWLEFNHVHINCFDKNMLFLKLEKSMDLRFISTKQV